MVALRSGELESRDDPACLGRVVARDRRFESFAERLRLAELPA